MKHCVYFSTIYLHTELAYSYFGYPMYIFLLLSAGNCCTAEHYRYWVRQPVKYRLLPNITQY